MTAHPRIPAWLTGSGVIAVGMGVMNVSTYGFTLVAAHVLGPRQYGALAALMGLMLVTAVVQLGLQTTAARRISTHPHQRVETEHEVLRASWRAAWALVGIATLASPVVVLLLRPGGPLGGYAAALLLAASCLPLTLLGAQAGLLQGERRWLLLATVYLGVGLGRVVLGFAGMVWREDVTGAMVGVALGNVVPILIGWAALRRRVAEDPDGTLEAPSDHAEPSASHTGVLKEVAHNSHALLAFFALTNTDVILARVLFDPHASGLYAGGLILAKAVLFLPQFVVVVAFPSLADPKARRRMEISALGVMLAMGLAATAAAAALRSLAVVFVGGSDYIDLEPLIWSFAAVGTLWAMEQLMVYSMVARQSRRSVAVLWLGVVALIVAAPLADTVGHLLSVVAVVHLLVLGMLVAVSQSAHLRRAPRSKEAPRSAGSRASGKALRERL